MSTHLLTNTLHPYFDNFSDFLAMGQHGIYVWSSWSMVFLSLLVFILYSKQQRKATVHEIKVKQAQLKHRRVQSVIKIETTNENTTN